VDISILPVSVETLAEYSAIPTAFEVSAVLWPELIDGGLGGIMLHEEAVAEPYVKDYDAFEEEGLTRWVTRFDTTPWALFLARDSGTAVGGATVVVRTPAVHMLAGRDDLAVLWDIRVLPERRRSGIGVALISEAAAWSRAQDCRYLKIETQNINVAACRFYAAQGCTLGEVNRFAYGPDPRVVHEVMLVWYLEL
jgi:ribosomal protein S18 acetylase RimI-like enzyme